MKMNFFFKLKQVNKPNLLHNILALGTVQVLGYMLPLITLPYVTRTLGVESWGTVVLVQAILNYFILVSSWGFNLSGTRKIAANRNQLENLSKIFMSIWMAQWILCVIACILLIMIIEISPFFEQTRNYYLFGLSLIFGNILFPSWFFNGVEKMKEQATIQILTRITSIPLTFIFINKQEDGPILIAIIGVTGILSGVISIIWIKRNMNLRWALPSTLEVLMELKEGSSVFLSTIWISFYTTITPIILGYTSGTAAVGYYAFADKFRNLAQSVLGPISQGLFPRLSNLFVENPSEAKKLLVKSSKIILLLALILSVILWFFSPCIVIIGGEDFRPAINVLKWLSPLPFIVSFSNILGVQVMIPNQRIKFYSGIYVICGTISLLLVLPLIILNGYIGASINTLITEMLVTILMGVYVWKSGLISKVLNKSK